MEQATLVGGIFLGKICWNVPLEEGRANFGRIDAIMAECRR